MINNDDFSSNNIVHLITFMLQLCGFSVGKMSFFFRISKLCFGVYCKEYFYCASAFSLSNFFSFICLSGIFNVGQCECEKPPLVHSLSNVYEKKKRKGNKDKKKWWAPSIIAYNLHLHFHVTKIFHKCIGSRHW